MTDAEIIKAIQQLLEPIKNTQDEIRIQLNNLDSKMNNLDNRVTNLEISMRKEFKHTHQDIETLVEVLEAKEILPKAQ